jgi:enterochelin esterase-like enzyme
MWIRIMCAVICVLTMLCSMDATLGQRRPPVISPEVSDDGSVTFRIRASKAESVELAGQWPGGRLAMEKSDGGVWEAKVDSIPAGVWEYSLRVDGMAMIDPGNTLIKPMRSPRTSILHIPGNPPRVHDFRQVPHGTVHSHTYHSKSLGKLRELVVYTPPGYDANGDTEFPALYLQHGSGDNQATWTVHGKAHWIIDNLIAAKRAQPMVVVMMDGHASPPDVARERRNEYFEKDLLQDVMPFVEANYRVSSDSVKRGIVGLSMGGGQSLTIGLRHTDKFAWVGGFSSSAPRKDSVASALQNASTTNEHLKLLWIACGKDDFLLERNEEFIAELKESSIEHEWHLTEGNHSWPVWREYLADFVPRIFH